MNLRAGLRRAGLSPALTEFPSNGMTDLVHIHLVSDATGETVHNVVRACMVQFEDVRHQTHQWPLVRTQRRLQRVLTEIAARPGPVLYTLVDADLQPLLIEGCHQLQVPCIPVLDPVIRALAAYFGSESSAEPGRQHALDNDYFERIAAMDFVMAHDDGQIGNHLARADVILVGVSRTSKTPTCIYLANRGIKAANIPFVPNCPLPDILDSDDAPLVVGLTKDPEALVQIRRNRLRQLHSDDSTDYTDIEAVAAEVDAARKLCRRKGWPIIDVSRRSIEETAAAIMQHLDRRRLAAEEAAQAGED